MAQDEWKRKHWLVFVGKRFSILVLLGSAAGPYSNGDTDLHANTHDHAYSHCYADVDSHSHRDNHAYSYADVDPDRYGNPNAYSYADVDAYSYFDKHTDPHAE